RGVVVLDVRELEEISQPESVAVHLDSGNGIEELDILRLQQVCPPNENSTGAIEKTRFTRSKNSGEQLVVQLLQIRRRMQAENHEIARQSLQSPVVVHSQQLPDAREACWCFQRCKENRIVS